MPFFSIILPTFNRAHMLPVAIASLIGQTYDDWELIIVDDGSTDNTKAVVDDFNESRILYKWQENQERSAARNAGIKIAKGRYICFLDSDDYFLSNHLSNLYKKIEKKEFPESVFMTGLKKCEINGTLLSITNPLPERENLHIFILENFLTVPSQSLAVRRTIFSKHRFPPNFSLWEDTHLWIRVLSEYALFNIEHPSVVIVSHAGSGINAGVEQVLLQTVCAYKNAVDDLFKDHLKGETNVESLKTNYLDSKFRMLLYYARQNRQFLTAFQILQMALGNKPSSYLISELAKIPLNYIGIGLNRDT